MKKGWLCHPFATILLTSARSETYRVTLLIPYHHILGNPIAENRAYSVFGQFS